MRAAALASAILIAACSGPAPARRTPAPAPVTRTPPPRPPAPRRLIITVISATIDPARPDRAAWDDVKKRPAPGAPVGGPLAEYLAQHAVLDGSLALFDGTDVAVTRRAAESAAADPAVLVELGGRVFRAPVRPGAAHPVWQFPLVATVADADLLHLTVIDWDDWSSYDVIGDRTITGRELVTGAPIELGRFGQVAALTLVAAPAPESAAARHRVAVPARPTWTQTGVAIVAGQEVSILAAGEICTKGDDRARCAGPEGQLKPSDSNLKGFEALGHGALVASIGDTRFAIGRERRFVAPSSGTLWLGINDRDPDNNRGELEVAVTLR